MKKRLKMQKPTAIIASLAMALSLAMAPGGVARADEAASVPEWAVDDGTQGESNKSAELPATLDLRDKGWVTPVKQQGPWGTCWAFGAISAAESSILSDANVTYDKANLNLSERHLAWFAVHPVTAEIDPEQAGEGAYAAKDGSVSLNTGGFNVYISTLFSQGVGPVTEKEFPYRGVDANGNSNTTEPSVPGAEFFVNPQEGAIKVLAGLGNITEEQQIEVIKANAARDGMTYEQALKEAVEYVTGLYLGATYSKDDDWSIPSEKRNTHAGLIIKDGNVLPTYRDKGSTEPNAASIAAMKQELNKGRGVLINYKADQALPGVDSDSTYINRTTWSQYTFEPAQDDHAVCIVGWDDNYPASNFTHTVYQREKDANGNYVLDQYGRFVLVKDAEGNPIVDEECTAKSTPPANGAWIVKNSWGSQTDMMIDDKNNLTGYGTYGERDSEGKATGYFHLSYYDQTVTGPETVSFSSNLLGPTGEISVFQHDYMPGMQGFYTEPSASVISSANVFDLKEEYGDQVVVSVGGRTSSENQRATFAIYQLNDGATSPTDGKLLRRVSSSFDYAGYHRLDLDEVLPIRAGRKYSIVSTITEQGADGTTSYSVSAGQGRSKKIMDWLYTMPQFKAANLVWTQAVINKGESFLYKDGTWVDWSDYVAGIPLSDDQDIEEIVQAGVELNRYTDVFPIDNFSLKMYAEPADIPAAEYRVVEGDGATWTRGSGTDLPFTFKRFDQTETDDTTFSHFASASVDDKAVERDKDYAAAEGSVEVNLKPAYLDSLTAGEHTVTATFDDGTATATFTVAEAPAPAADPKPAASTNTNSTVTATKNTTPLAKTADPTSLAAVATTAAAGAAALVVGRRKRR